MKRRGRLRGGIFLLLVGGWVLFGVPVQADTVNFDVFGIMGTGVTANVDFTVDCDGTTCTLTIAIENTTPAGVGGEITGFGFNTPAGVTPSGVSLDTVTG